MCRFFLFSMIFVSTLPLGCRSFSSTPLTRTENDGFFGDSNGMLKRKCRTRPTKGVPVTVSLTTHTDVWIEEDYYVEFDPANPTVLREPLSDIRMLKVRAEPVQTQKVVVVDFKRPAAGTLDMSMDFNDNQFFKQVQSKIQDETITESSKLLRTVLDAVFKEKCDFY